MNTSLTRSQMQTECFIGSPESQPPRWWTRLVIYFSVYSLVENTFIERRLQIPPQFRKQEGMELGGTIEIMHFKDDIMSIESTSLKSNQ